MLENWRALKELNLEPLDAESRADPAQLRAVLPLTLNHLSIWEIGGARRNRTADLLHAMQALYQLSYDPLNHSSPAAW
jgi:hypothetical protein